MDIIIDFDGTVVSHEFPNVGKDIGAIKVLNELIENGHRLILFTMRSNNGDLPLITPQGIVPISGDFLDDAIAWFEFNCIPLFGIQTNPGQEKWTSSPKAYGQIIIDDVALGCPLKIDETISKRPFVDWKKVRKLLIKQGVIVPKIKHQ